LVPAAAFVAWFFAFDTRQVLGAPGTSRTLLYGASGFGYVVSLFKFVTTGLQASANGVFGLSDSIPIVALLVAAILAWRWYKRGGASSQDYGLLGGLVGWFVLTGLGRVQMGTDSAAQSRYVYVGIVLLLPVL